MSEFHPWTLEGLTSKMVTKAKVELGETVEIRREALNTLKNLIKEEPDFYPFMDESFLLRFLRARKFDVSRAFKTLRNYYKYKADYSGVFTDFLPSEVVHVFDMKCSAILPFRDQEGSIILALKGGLFDLDKGTTNDLMAAFLLAVDLALRYEATQVCGAILLLDMSDVTFRHLRHATNPLLIYRAMKSVQDCLPIRLKAMHIVNGPFQMIFNVMKAFLTDKMQKRFQIHGKNLENFHKCLPPEILPSEFGGCLGPMCNDETRDVMLSLESQYVEQNRYGYLNRHE